MDLLKGVEYFRKIFPIMGMLTPGISGYGVHSPSLLYDPNERLIDEMWELIMEKLDDPKDKWSLANTSIRLQALFKSSSCNWLFPLILPVLMRQSGNENVLNCRLVSFGSFNAIQEYSDERFNETDFIDELEYKYLSPMRLEEHFGDIHSITKYFERMPRQVSFRTPFMTQSLSIFENIHIQEVLRLFPMSGANVKNVWLYFDVSPLSEIRMIIASAFANCPKMIRLTLYFNGNGFQVDENLLFLPFPPAPLKYLRIEFDNWYTSYISFWRVFKNLEYLYTDFDIFFVRQQDLDSLTNLKFLRFNCYNLRWEHSRQVLYQGLLQLNIPDLREIQFNWTTTYNASPKEGSVDAENVTKIKTLSKMFKKRCVAIMKHKFPQRNCSEIVTQEQQLMIARSMIFETVKLTILLD